MLAFTELEPSTLEVACEFEQKKLQVLMGLLWGMGRPFRLFATLQSTTEAFARYYIYISDLRMYCTATLKMQAFCLTLVGQI